ncbi:MAG: calcium-binding protein [Lysobacter sp.]
MATLVLCLVCASGFARGGADDDFASTAERIRSGASGHRLVLLGETHGTREIPDLIATLVAAYVADGPVLLGLEIPRSEHAAVTRYLNSDGGEMARGTLRVTPFWAVTDDQHDGRRSEDMLDLIEALRGLRSDGHDVAILPYDVERSFHRFSGDARDEAMAGRVRAAYAALSRGRLLVLGGNVHAMLRRPTHAPRQMQVPMGQHLLDLAPYSVRIDANAGQSWACMNPCGPVPVTPNTLQAGAPAGMFAQSYHLQVVLPRFTIARLLGTASPR